MKRGFTLIELLVVIAIIGVLSSVVLASLNSARVKANDARIRSDLRSLTNALALYYNDNGSYPPNVNPSNHDITINLQTLVTNGYIGTLPTSPNPSYPYYYYNYGAGNVYGAHVVGMLMGDPSPTTAGYPGTCRPWTSGQNWCDQTVNNYYCLCLLH